MTRSRKSSHATDEKVVPSGHSRSQSLVLQLSNDLMRRIRDGELAEGTRLPSVRKYAQECSVSNETVLRVYDKLVALGYLEARRGAGFFVTSGQLQHEQRPSWANVSEENGWSWRRMLPGTDGQAMQGSLGSGALPTAWIDNEAMTHALQRLQQTALEGIVSHADPHGYRPLRQQLQSKLLEQGIRAPVEQIITTNGASDALNLVIWSHFYPRDYILVEEPAPFLHVQRALASGLEIIRIPRQEDGPDLDALQAACEAHKPRAFFTSSVLQSPSSTCMSPYKAHQLLKIAETHNLLVIDDDTYGDLLPLRASGSVARLAAFDQLERVIHIGSFSKTVAPSLRSGFLAASPRCIERILLYRSIGTIHGPLLTDLFMHQILDQGNYRQHCEALQNKLDAVRDNTRQALEAMGCQVTSATSGMYLWANLGVDANAVAQQCDKLGILTAPGSAFLAHKVRSSHMRFNIASMSMQPQAMHTLADVLGALRV